MRRYQLLPTAVRKMQDTTSPEQLKHTLEFNATNSEPIQAFSSPARMRRPVLYRKAYFHASTHTATIITKA
jgi:hypothetical protein